MNLTDTDPADLSRAVVLGGGGVTGIAWEIGVLAGLLEQGVDLREADIVIGTSAGAFVGAAVASGADVEGLYAAQLVPDEREVATSAPPELFAEWLQAYQAGGVDRVAVGKAFGEIARAHPEPVAPEVRRRVVEARLVTREWPRSLRVTALDAETGELEVFHAASGVPLLDAVSASGAVPGVWPVQRIGDRMWTDGGMASPTNARLAEGHDRVVVIAPLPWGVGELPGADTDVEVLAERAQAVLIAPDDASMEAFGPNPYDPARRPPAAEAGRVQGRNAAASVAALW